MAADTALLLRGLIFGTPSPVPTVVRLFALPAGDARPEEKSARGVAVIAPPDGDEVTKREVVVPRSLVCNANAAMSRRGRMCLQASAILARKQASR